MQRRSFLSATAAAGLAAGSASAADKPMNQYFHLLEFQLRNSRSKQRQRLVDFFEQSHLPALKRVGVPAGYFQISLGENTPRLYVLTVYDSLGDYEKQYGALWSDEKFMAAGKAFEAGEPAYDRISSSMMRALDGMPKINIPKPNDEPRHFDLRRYEAETFFDLREKMNMFNTEEIAIFKKVGINPLFLGQTIIGPRQPNLTYMAFYDNMAARDKAWQAFGASPDWNRIKDKPGWGNDDIVMTVSNTFLRPLPFSPIR